MGVGVEERFEHRNKLWKRCYFSHSTELTSHTHTLILIGPVRTVEAQQGIKPTSNFKHFFRIQITSKVNVSFVTGDHRLSKFPVILPQKRRPCSFAPVLCCENLGFSDLLSVCLPSFNLIGQQKKQKGNKPRLDLFKKAQRHLKHKQANEGRGASE